jgi:hypothetical protein
MKQKKNTLSFNLYFIIMFTNLSCFVLKNNLETPTMMWLR